MVVGRLELVKKFSPFFPPTDQTNHEQPSSPEQNNYKGTEVCVRGRVLSGW